MCGEVICVAESEKFDISFAAKGKRFLLAAIQVLDQVSPASAMAVGGLVRSTADDSGGNEKVGTGVGEVPEESCFASHWGKGSVAYRVVVVLLVDGLGPVFGGDVGVGHNLFVEWSLREFHRLCGAVEDYIDADVPADLLIDRDVPELGTKEGGEMVELVGVGTGKDDVVNVDEDERGQLRVRVDVSEHALVVDQLSGAVSEEVAPEKVEPTFACLFEPVQGHEKAYWLAGSSMSLG